MVKQVRVDDLISDKDYAYPKEDVEVVSRSDEVCTMWGIGTLMLTEKHIKELRNGKCIYFTDGEYATVIYMKEGKNK